MLIDHQKLYQLCTEIQVRFGIPESEAKIVSECLVEADLMGINTHGVIRLKLYMDRIKAGGSNPNPNIKIVRDNKITTLIDADNALGPVGGKFAMDKAIEKTKVNGVGIIIIRNCNHYGPAGYYARMALEHNMIGISLTNVLASMPPTDGAEVRIGNNAYAIAFPAMEEFPIVVDGATSVSSWGRLFLCLKNGDDLPPESYIDKHGNFTQNPQDVLDGGALMPFAGHKGYGIAVAIELLTGMLAGSALDHEIPHPYMELSKPGLNTFFMSAISISDFIDPEQFKKNVDNWIKYIRSTKKQPGKDRIWLPGEKEFYKKKQQIIEGISLDDEIINELKILADSVSVEFDPSKIFKS
ncbi:MAG: Ldh family oxidoreductase [bacterium]